MERDRIIFNSGHDVKETHLRVIYGLAAWSCQAGNLLNSFLTPDSRNLAPWTLGWGVAVRRPGSSSPSATSPPHHPYMTITISTGLFQDPCMTQRLQVLSAAWRKALSVVIGGDRLNHMKLLVLGHL